MLRRSVIAALLAAAAALLGAGYARAANPPVRPALGNSLATTHFVIHYDSDKSKADYITQSQASTLAGDAEVAYATEVGTWGFDAPPNDGDGKVDIYVVDLSSWTGLAGVANPDGIPLPDTGSIDFAKTVIDSTWEMHTIAHELFHLIQFRYFDAALSDHWLLEGEAEWAGYKVDGYFEATNTLGPPDLSLDCFDPAGLNKCASDTYANGGYSRWGFYELLTDRYGPLILKDALVDAQAAGGALTGLQNAVAAKGGTLADTVNDYAHRLMTGGWGVSALDHSDAPTAFTTVSTGIATASLGTQNVSVDHLATRYVGFTRGDGAGDHPCFAATLTISVAMPAGVNARPFLYWNSAGSAAVPLTVSGNTATATVPWDTCLWSANKALLSLTNASTTLDAQSFAVTTSLTVDPNTPAAATTAPPQSVVYGGTTDVSSATVAPSITVLGPLLFQVSAASPTLRLIVQSTGDGKVHATLGGVDLGSPDVRAGNNDLRFTIPASALSALRRSSASGANVLTLTPVAPNGQQTGAAVTRTVAVKAKPKKKKH